MAKAVCPGSFDPVTNGHVDVIERAAQMFEEVIVAVAVNPAKKPLFSIQERIEMIKASCRHLKNVKVDSFDGLLVRYVQKVGAKVIVKGLRAVSDFDYEFQMAAMNRQLAPDVDTIFVMTKVEYAYLSSSIVKEIAMLGGKIEGLVPDVVARRLREIMAEKGV